MKLSSSLFVLSLACSAPAAANPGVDSENVLSVSTYVAHDPIAAGSGTEIAVVVELHGSWHINAAKPNDPLLIPTKLSFDPLPGVTPGEPGFPAPKEKRFEFSEQPLLVYEGKFTIKVPLEIGTGTPAGEQVLGAKLRYQACDDERCLAPKNETIALKLRVGAQGSESRPAHPEVFGQQVAPAVTPARTPGSAAPPASGSLAPASGAGGAGAGLLSADSVRRWFEGGSYLRSFLLIFLIGLALNLTPCIYPVIPLTLGYFAYESERRSGKTFSLALTYVLGMATMYSALGVFAALSGKAFGAALANPWVLVFEAAVMVVLALSMFGFYEISVPAALAAKLSASPSGHLGALFMGLSVGIVAAPCLAPAVLGLFVLVAQLQSVALGFSVFFVLALGLGLPFLVLGTAAGAISRLPRSGEWMVWIKHLFGVILLGMALYFLRPTVGNSVFLWGLVALTFGGALWLGYLDKAGASSPTFRKIKLAVGLLLLVGAGSAFSAVIRPAGPGQRGIVWRDYDHGSYARALSEGRPVLVDFTAEWCLPCKELEHSTFSEASVMKASERFVALRADGTIDNPLIDELRGKFDVQGYPTVLLIDSKGEEREELRVVGFVGPQDFLARLQQVD